MNDNYEPEHRAEEDPVVGDPPPRAHTLFSNNVYDKLKFVALVLLPGVGTLYFAVAGLWGLPKADEVVGTIVAIDTFLGLLLGLSNKQYNDSDERYDGAVDVSPDEENGVTNLNFSLDPRSITEKDEIVLKIRK
jgi:hypothetical protein